MLCHHLDIVANQIYSLFYLIDLDFAFLGAFLSPPLYGVFLISFANIFFREQFLKWGEGKAKIIFLSAQITSYGRR